MAGRSELARLARQIAGSDVPGVPSPCVSVCRMDPVSGLCEGCCRTIGEIAAWSALDDEAKRAVWHAIAQRAVAAVPLTLPSPRSGEEK
ncbi:MAG TPA: DUF1289 domain-containing protein, partial [Ramlibacter sp.]|nr:DUF1289 domain-containing protein [Ramlibacter sp.]